MNTTKRHSFQIIIRGEIDGRYREWAGGMEDEVTLSYALNDLLLRAGIAGLSQIRQIKIVRW